MKAYKLTFIIILILSYSCEGTKSKQEVKNELQLLQDSISNIEVQNEPPKDLTAENIVIIKNLVEDSKFYEYTIADEYPYKDTVRIFQWNKIKERLAYLENKQREKAVWGVLSNYKNQNREAPLVSKYVRNDYSRITDTLGVERYQSIPLYSLNDSVQPVRYGRDGWLVNLLTPDTLDIIRVEGISFEGTYNVPKRYIIPWGDTVYFDKAVVVDVTNQNITTVQKTDTAWVVYSMNPCTTGRRLPPYAKRTPVGLYAIQQKMLKMLYTHDGSTELAGYAPYASRFTNGAYLHGVPTNSVNAPIIEYSQSLGTIPRSHMCVRNASSHAKFIYDWAKIKESVVFVID